MAFMEIEGHRLFYRDVRPEKERTVMLLHGIGASSEYWEKLMASGHFEEFRLLAPDLLGFGRSDKPMAYDYTFQSQARILRSCLEALDINRICLVGHSMGGSIGLNLTLIFPHLVERLVLVDTTLDPSYISDVFRQISDLEESEFDVVFPMLTDAAEETVSQFFEAPSQETLEMSARVVKQATSYSFHRSLKGTTLFLNEQQVFELFKGLQIPHYYIFGTTDEEVAGMVKEHFGSEPWVHAIKGVKHIPMLEDPAHFCSVLSKILAE